MIVLYKVQLLYVLFTFIFLHMVTLCFFGYVAFGDSDVVIPLLGVLRSVIQHSVTFRYSMFNLRSILLRSVILVKLFYVLSGLSV
jgi:hypothetical protein